MSLLDSASLIVTPNGYKEGKLYSVIPSDGSGDLSVTRATTATRVNSAGLVELVPYNLNSYSENFTLSWGTDGTSTATNNFTTAPNGTQTAAKVVANFANGYAYKSLPVAVGTYTLSFYVKASAPTTISIDFNDVGAGIFGQVFNLTTEWQRISFTHNVTGGSNLYITYSSLQLGVEYYIWGAQLVEGSVAKDYQKTETRLNIPRLDYSNGTCPSILVEPQRTNVVLQSSSFDSTTWQNGPFNTIVANAIISPDGTQNADKIESIGGGGQIRYTNQPISTTIGTYSIYMKAGELNEVLMYGAGDGIFWNLTDGSFIGYYAGGSNITSYSSEDVGNGWYRYTMTNTNGFSYAEIYMSVNQTLGTAIPSGQGFYLWGAQVEAGSYATSYIPTTSASVTRNADEISKTGISSLIGQTEGTIFIDAYRTQKSANYQALIGLGNGTSSSQMMEFFYRSSNELTIGVYNSGQQFVNNTVIANGRHKIALAYKANDFALYIDGVLIATDNSGTVPTMNQLNIGGFNYTSGDEYADGINAVALWKTRLTNAQLATLTTI